MILKNGKRIDGCTDTLPVGTVQPFLGLTPPLGYLVCQGQLISKIEYPELYRICGSTFGAETETHFYLPDLRGKTIAGYDNNDSAMNTIGKLLGNKTHTHTSAAHTHTIAGHTHTTGNHTLTVAEMPSHMHEVMQRRNGPTPVSSYYNTNYTSGSAGYFLKNDAKGVNTGSTDNLFTSYTGSSGAHNHGNTGSTSLTTDSTTPGATGSNTNFQPTITMNWIVKAAMLIPEYFVVENTLTSTSTNNALSAAKGKALNDKFDNYVSLHTTNNMDGTLVFRTSTNSSICIQNTNTNHESSILFAHTDFDNENNKKGYTLGYGTNAYDGMGLWSWENGDNILTVNKNGNLHTKGNIDGLNIKGNGSSWSALHVGTGTEQYRLQLESNGIVNTYYSSNSGAKWSIYKPLMSGATLKTKTMTVTVDAGRNAHLGSAAGWLIVGAEPNVNKATSVYRYNNNYYLRELASYGGGDTFSVTIYYYDI